MAFPTFDRHGDHEYVPTDDTVLDSYGPLVCMHCGLSCDEENQTQIDRHSAACEARYEADKKAGLA